MTTDRRTFLKILGSLFAAPAIPVTEVVASRETGKYKIEAARVLQNTWDFGLCEVAAFSISLTAGELVTSRVALRSLTTGAEVVLETFGEPDERLDAALRHEAPVRLGAVLPDGELEALGTRILLDGRELGSVRSIEATYREPRRVFVEKLT